MISSLCWSTIPFGGLVAGPVVTGVGLDPSMLAFGIGYLLLTLLPIVLPVFRQMNDRPEPVVEPADRTDTERAADTTTPRLATLRR